MRLRSRARLEADEPGVTFNSHVAPILFTHCAGCHRPGGVAPFSVLTYNAARQHARQIGVATQSRYMPPWKSEAGLDKFIGQQQLTDAEIDVIQRWIAAGAPEGDPKQRPPLPRSNGEWQLGKPDLVVRTREAYTLKAEGADTFHLFVLPIPVDQSRFIAGVEFRPDNPRVVHHANILIDPTPQSRERNAQDAALGEQGLLPGSARYPEGHFLGWTPGQPDPLLPKGLAWRLDPGTDLVVQLHMQPSGKPEPIRFSVALFFSAAPPERTPVMLRLGRQDIDIPAGERTYTTADSYVLPVDVEVLAIKPHAHFRARDVKGWATLPDGTRRSLIHIPDWDFRWQNVYRFETAPLLTKGTVLRMEYTYDNSADNPRNPQQPPQRVRWGPKSSDEMGDLWIQVLPRDDRNVAALNRDFGRKKAAQDVVGYEGLIAGDPENVALHGDVALLYLELGQWPQAVTHYESVVRLNPRMALAHFNLGVALALSGRRDEAIARYQRALQLDPDYTAAHNNLGNALFEDHRLDAALARVPRGLTVAAETRRRTQQHWPDPDDPGAPDRGDGLFREALRFDPRSADAHYNIGVALQKQGQLAEAAGHFRRAVQLKADWPAALADLAWLLATSDDGVRDAS